ncbi:MAG: InlB B-repeat-containing protein [Actinomycetota bacterium]
MSFARLRFASVVAVALAALLALLMIVIPVRQIDNDVPNRILPQGSPPVTANWTRTSTHVNAPYFYYRIEFSEGVSGLTPEDFDYTGTLQNCTFSPSKGELDEEPSLGVEFAQYPTVYHVMIACKGTGSITPRISGRVAVPFADVDVLNEPIEVDRAVTVTADPILTVTRMGDGDGYVSSTTSSFQCGQLCSNAYLKGVYGSNWPVSLRATAFPGSIFTGWSGACSGTGICQMKMSKSFWVGATFERAGGIILQKVGSGKGSISSSPAGVSCSVASISCTSWHRFGSVLTLTARASSGSRFVGWAGACGGNGTCVVRLVAGEDPVALYAIFD